MPLQDETSEHRQHAAQLKRSREVVERTAEVRAVLSPTFASPPRVKVRMASEKPAEICACGTTFLEDAAFCRKCGARRFVATSEDKQSSNGDEFMSSRSGEVDLDSTIPYPLETDGLPTNCVPDVFVGTAYGKPDALGQMMQGHVEEIDSRGVCTIVYDDGEREQMGYDLVKKMNPAVWTWYEIQTINQLIGMITPQSAN